jgi:hypothetical protein
MAEWTGPKRTLNSIDPVEEPPAGAASDHLPPPPPAPGATSSPQIPGMTPDDPELPGRERGTMPPLASNRRPLTEYGTAQRLLRLFTPAPGTELQASDWEQGPAAGEELRKADPGLLPPLRPVPGYGLAIGHSATAIAPESLAELGDTTEAILPAEGATTAQDSSVSAAPPAATSPAPAQATAAGIPLGAVAGNGTTTCPPGFPVKANAQSKIYHTPESRVYAQTVAEYCFATPEAAQAAGYRSPKNL